MDARAGERSGREHPDTRRAGADGQVSRLQVVFLADCLGFPNGMAASNRVRLQALAMLCAGASPHVLCLQASERPPFVENHATRGDWHGVTFEYACGTTLRHSAFLMRRIIEVRGWLTGAWRLVQLRRTDSLDCVFLWFTCQRAQLRRAVFVGLLHIMRVPVIMELNERPWSLRADQNVAERSVSPLTGMAGVVSISSHLTQWACAEAAARRHSALITEVPILVDMAEQPHPRDLPAGDPLLVFAGAPQYDETIDFILRAMTFVWRDHPTCRLAITGARAGDPAARTLAERLAGTSGGDSRVLLVGYLSRQELLELYQDARALLIPLFDDVRSKARFPTKTGEYLASARPIVTTSIGEMARAFTDGQTAMVAPPGDPEGYARKICAVLADEDLARHVGAAGREYARTHFHYELHGRSLMEAFAQAGSRAGRRRARSVTARMRWANVAARHARRLFQAGTRGHG